MLHSSTDTTFGAKSRASFYTTRENIRDSKARSQRRLSRSALETKNAEGKISQLEKKLAEEKGRINMELHEKMIHAQRLIDEEAQIITANIRIEIEHEIRRECEIMSLISSLESSIEIKESEISTEEVITSGMMTVRSKVTEGAISLQIDHVLEQKAKVAAIDRKLVQDLEDCVVELELFFQQTKDRSISMSNTLQHFGRADVNIAKSYTWNDVDAMEQILELGVVNADMSKKTVEVVRDWVNEAALDKSDVLGEAVPATLKEVDNRRKAERAHELTLRNRLQQLQTTTTASIEEVKHVKDLDNSSESEVLGEFAKAAGEAAFAGSKMVMFGLKSILDLSTASGVGAKATEAFKKSSGVTNGISDLSKKINMIEENSEAVEDLKEIIQSEIMKDTLKSTGETLGAMGQVAGEIAGNVKDMESSKKSRKCGNGDRTESDECL